MQVYLKGTSKKVVGGCCPSSLRAIDHLPPYNIRLFILDFPWDFGTGRPNTLEVDKFVEISEKCGDDEVWMYREMVL